jgi:HKD family nuclease
MAIRFVDNVNVKMADVLCELLPGSRRAEIAVAFVRYSGLRLIEAAMDECLGKGGDIEFVVGLDFHTTDAESLRALHVRAEAGSRLRLYCYGEPADGRGTYHPKLYLLEKGQTVTAIVGSSNLTEGGLRSNVEVNVALDFDVETQEARALRGIYDRIKYQLTRFAPDADYIGAYAEAVKRARARAEAATREDAASRAIASVRDRERVLPTPVGPDRVLGGWQKLVLAKLPPGDFKGIDLYQHARDFQRFYPENRNVEAKIRQVLQQLRDLGLVRHAGAGQWTNLYGEAPGSHAPEFSARTFPSHGEERAPT